MSQHCVLTIQCHLQRWLLLQVLSMPTWGKLASLLLVVIPLLMGGAALYHRATGTEWCGTPRSSKSDVCLKRWRTLTQLAWQMG